MPPFLLIPDPEQVIDTDNLKWLLDRIRELAPDAEVQHTYGIMQELVIKPLPELVSTLEALTTSFTH
jgi:hypothetical protein